KPGRDFAEADDLPGSRKVVLITNALWQRRFGGARDVLGQQIMIDGASREIIGIVPEQVGLPRLAEVYLPMDELRAEDGVLRRGNHPGFSVLGRLKPGVTLAQAADDMNNIARDLAQRYPEDDAGRTVSTRILLEASVADYRQSVWLLSAAVATVASLLIGLWPALRISRVHSLSLELHQGAGRAASEGLSRQRIRALLVVAQMALALVLLAAAGLTLKSFWRAQNAPLGFDPRG